MSVQLCDRPQVYFSDFRAVDEKYWPNNKSYITRFYFGEESLFTVWSKTSHKTLPGSDFVCLKVGIVQLFLVRSLPDFFLLIY